jgi:nucleoside 2-deoxyribosyltransferase
LKIYIICPVRNATKEQTEKLKEYKKSLLLDGHEVYYPADDNPYEESDNLIGYIICEENRRAIAEADEIHIFWDATSTGTLFDLGMAFALYKPLKIVNYDELKFTPQKSFTNMINEWSK